MITDGKIPFMCVGDPDTDFLDNLTPEQIKQFMPKFDKPIGKIIMFGTAGNIDGKLGKSFKDVWMNPTKKKKK